MSKRFQREFKRVKRLDEDTQLAHLHAKFNKEYDIDTIEEYIRTH